MIVVSSFPEAGPQKAVRQHHALIGAQADMWPGPAAHPHSASQSQRPDLTPLHLFRLNPSSAPFAKPDVGELPMMLFGTVSSDSSFYRSVTQRCQYQAAAAVGKGINIWSFCGLWTT